MFTHKNIYTLWYVYYCIKQIYMHPFNYQAISPIPTQISDTTLTKTDQMAYCSFSIADCCFRTSPDVVVVMLSRLGTTVTNLGQQLVK